MANLNRVVYLSEAQKNTLFTTGTVTSGQTTITYNENDLYITPQTYDSTPTSGSENLITSGGVYTALNNPSHTILAGGAAGEVLTKNSNDDYDASWATPVVTRGTGTNSAQVVNESWPNTASGANSFAANSQTVASGEAATAFGDKSIASGPRSFAGGAKSSQVDFPTTASGNQSFAFGLSAQATGTRSVALGEKTLASAAASFAMGNQSTASGMCSVAIGQIVEAQAVGSAAFGDRITSTGRACTVVGAFNVLDANAEDSSHGTGARKYIFMVGNGTADDARSNAMTVDWAGDVNASTSLSVASAVSMVYNSTTQALDFVFA